MMSNGFTPTAHTPTWESSLTNTDSQSYDECWPDAHLYHHHHHLHHHHIHQHSSPNSQMWPIPHNHPQQQSLTQNPGPRGSGNNSLQKSAMASKKIRRRVATLAQRRAANIRERRRMYNLNEAFDKLRRKVPTFAYEKRLSRIETLRLAITYIGFMTELLQSTPRSSGGGGDPIGQSPPAAYSTLPQHDVPYVPYSLIPPV